MALPVIELIAQNVLQTVSGITTSTGANYTLTAQRHTKGGDLRRHLNAVIIQEDPKEPPHQPNVNTYEWMQTFGVCVWIDPPEEDPTPIDQYINLVWADAHKAFVADRYRGGNALDTTIKPPQIVSKEAAGMDAVIINVEVNYRTAETDPCLRV